ncbi:MAG: phage tail tip lysozyme [Lachnospiraceae bacterium]|nr:phage tail tip lysozyme [Lachnospiraceae bacterium]
MKKRLFMLLTAAMLTQSVAPVLPAMTATVFAEESSSAMIFRMLTEEGGLNSAAACGILGNIQQESGLNPNAQSSYYGLAQWGGSRLSNLRSYCSENGYDSSSISGQIHFLIYELQNGYTGVYDALLNVSDDADGAYSAACTFCHDFEQCGNYDWEYSTRGGFASTFWSQYGGTVTAEEETDEEEYNEDTEETSDEDYTEDSENTETAEDTEDSSDDVEDTDDEQVEESAADTDDEQTENSDDESDAYSDSDHRYLLSMDYDVDLIFDYDYYVSRYPDVVESVGSDYDAVLRNFLTSGTERGRRGSQNFSVLNYMENNDDLVDRYGEEYVKYYVHFVKTGHDEGRSGVVSSEQQESEKNEAEEEAEWQEYLDSIGMTEEEWVEQNS